MKTKNNNAIKNQSKKFSLYKKINKISNLSFYNLLLNGDKRVLIIRLIFVVIIIIAATFLIWPLIPGWIYPISLGTTIDNPPYPLSYISYPSGNQDQSGDADLEKIYLTQGNRLYIPQIGVDSEIIEGTSLDVLSYQEGVWHEVGSASPFDDGNTVIAGHRFQYLPPNTHTFYNLDKLKIGDKLKVFWNGIEFTYEVFKTFEVFPNEVWIRNPEGNEKELTLYTCTPIYTSEKRLVVKAKMI